MKYSKLINLLHADIQSFPKNNFITTFKKEISLHNLKLFCHNILFYYIKVSGTPSGNKLIKKTDILTCEDLTN